MSCAVQFPFPSASVRYLHALFSLLSFSPRYKGEMLWQGRDNEVWITLTEKWESKQ